MKLDTFRLRALAIFCACVLFAVAAGAVCVAFGAGSATLAVPGSVAAAQRQASQPAPVERANAVSATLARSRPQ
jgi:uncharacterized membrane protein YfcA